MPNLGPELYKFLTYAHYDPETPKMPRLIAYQQPTGTPSNAEAERLRQHADEEDIEFTLIVTRTVREDQFKRSTKHFSFDLAGANTVEALAAIDHLRQLHPGEFERFTQACWENSWARLSQNFPQMWPKP
jgi:hypothetical protein